MDTLLLFCEIIAVLLISLGICIYLDKKDERMLNSLYAKEEKTNTANET